MRKAILCVAIALISLILAGCGRPRPDVTQQMIDYAVDVITHYDMVQEAAITVKDDMISMAIIVPYSVSVRYAKELGDNFVRALGTAAAIYNKDLTGPTMGSYGSLYNHYTLFVTIANPNKNTVASAIKASTRPSLKWE